MSEILVKDRSHTCGKGTRDALTVLENINLEFRSGSFNTTLGTSLCGKSPLLKMMARLHAPTEGSISLDRNRLAGTEGKRGTVFQQDAVFPWMTMARNVSYGPRHRGARRRQQRALEAKWV